MDKVDDAPVGSKPVIAAVPSTRDGLPVALSGDSAFERKAEMRNGVTVHGLQSRRGYRWSLSSFGVVLGVFLLGGCATLQSVFALSSVDFHIDGLSAVRVAGVESDRLTRYENLRSADLLRIGTAISQGTLPLSATIELGGSNPEGNPDARLLALDWVLFLRDRETVRGVMEEEISLPAGETTRVPVSVELDLMEFFQGSGRDLIDLALGIAGIGEDLVELRFEVRPSIGTPLGPIRYPRPLVLTR